MITRLMDKLSDFAARSANVDDNEYRVYRTAGYVILVAGAIALACLTGLFVVAPLVATALSVLAAPVVVFAGLMAFVIFWAKRFRK